jgi:vacuolar-type H+-ATPase subunit H
LIREGVFVSLVSINKTNDVMLKRFIQTLFLFFCVIYVRAQERDSLVKIPSRFIEQVSSKSGQLQQKLDQKSEKALRQMQQLEHKMIKKLKGLDSAKAKEITGDAEQQYKKLKQRLEKVSSLRQYISSLDTLSSSVQFLSENQQLLAKAGGINQKLNTALANIKGLETEFQKADEIQNFLTERKRMLVEQLRKFGFGKELRRLGKKTYYFKAQIAEYKATLKDQKQLEKKVIELLSNTKLFRDFMNRNSFLARLFPMPFNAGNFQQQAAQSGFAGLQTRVQVTSFIQQAGFSGPNAVSQLQQNIQDAQSEISKLRDEIARLGGISGDDLEIPDFKINSQKTKSFFKRVEIGTNIQSQKAKTYFPAISDLGLSVGYRLNDKSVAGIGLSYKLGLGKGWNNIRMTNQGVGLRTFIDWKIKGSFWVSGGYEQNYRTEFRKIEELKNLSAWQQSGLVGLTKTISLKTKFFRKTKLQLLWDFLSYQQVPATQPLLFRIGYNF